MPERISSVASRVRSWSIAGVKAIRIGEPCGPGSEGAAKVRGRVDRAMTSKDACPGVPLSVRLAADVVTAAAGAEVLVTKKACCCPPEGAPLPTIVPAPLIPSA